MWKQLLPAFRITLFLTVLTGLLYPALITGLAQVLFRHQANGSIVSMNDRPIGSTLIGQNFAKPEYLHPRPSAAGNDGYDGTASSGSNFGPTNQKLIDRTKASAAAFHKDNPDYSGALPSDLITASGSGLDPHISPESALAQTARIAQARGTSKEAISKLVTSNIQGRDLGFLGEPRLNVLKFNLALDREFPIHK